MYFARCIQDVQRVRSGACGKPRNMNNSRMLVPEMPMFAAFRRYAAQNPWHMARTLPIHNWISGDWAVRISVQLVKSTFNIQGVKDEKT